MDFARLKNESTLMMILVEISAEIIYQSDGSLSEWSVGVSKYQTPTQECSPLLQSCAKVMTWLCHVNICQGSTSRPSLYTSLVSGSCTGAPKLRMYGTV